MTKPPSGRLPRSAWRVVVVLTLASTADWYLLLAGFWIAAERGWDGGQLALLVLASRLPTFIGGTLGGRAVDRLGPRTMMLADVATRGAMFTVLTVLGLSDQDGYVALLAVSAVCGAASPITYAGSRVLMPQLVPQEKWGRANTVLSLGDQLPVVLSALLVGPALLWFGAGAYAVPVVLLLGAGLLIWRLPSVDARTRRAEQVSTARGPSPWTPSVVALLGLSTFYFLVFGPFPPLLPVLVRDNLGGGADTYALMRVVVGLGALCGLPLAPWLSRFSRPGVVNALGAIAYGVALFPLVLLHSVVPAAALYFVTGVIWGPYAAVEATAIQRWVSTGHLGRVFGAQRALSITAIPVGGAVGSIALDHFSAPTIMGSAAIACSVVGVLALAFRPLRRPAGPTGAVAAVVPTVGSPSPR